MKVCVISNSHAASLKTGYETIQENFPDMEVTFFASPAFSLRSLICQDGVLLSKNEGVQNTLRLTSGGLDRIQVNDFDRFLVYGLHFNIRPDAGQVSNAVLRALFQEHHKTQLNHQVAAMLLPLAPERVWVGPCPLPAALDMPATRDSSAEYNKAVDGYRQLLRGCRINLLPQPPETVEGGFATKRSFAQGAARMKWDRAVWDEDYPPGDRFHMNTEFGALYMTHLFRALLQKQVNE
jgi:hypothetical protein